LEQPEALIRRMKEEVGYSLLGRIIGTDGDGGYLFTSWEPGQRNQIYFLTMNGKNTEVEGWLDSTMNYFFGPNTDYIIVWKIWCR